jgi:hypothetical protein
MKNRIIAVKAVKAGITTWHAQDSIALADIAKGFEGESALLKRWLKNKDTRQWLARIASRPRI